MKPSSCLVGVAIACAASALSDAANAEIIDVNYTIDAPLTRVAVPAFQSGDSLLLGPAKGAVFFLCHTSALLKPEALRERLAANVSARVRSGGVQSLRLLVEQIGSASSAYRKLQLAFGEPLVPGLVSGSSDMTSYGDLMGPVSATHAARLQMGQEVSLPESANQRPFCYTNAQVDQIIGEAVRVTRAVADQLSPPAPQPSGPAVNPGARQIQR